MAIRCWVACINTALLLATLASIMEVVEDILVHHFTAWLAMAPVISAKAPITTLVVFSTAEAIVLASQSTKDL